MNKRLLSIKLPLFGPLKLNLRPGRLLDHLVGGKSHLPTESTVIAFFVKAKWERGPHVGLCCAIQLTADVAFPIQTVNNLYNIL